MNKKVTSRIVSVALLLAAIVTVWIYYPKTTEKITTNEEKKVKEMLMMSSEHINSGMESVERIGEFDKIKIDEYE